MTLWRYKTLQRVSICTYPGLPPDKFPHIRVIIVARDAKIRLIALAQGENVATWGLEGESDLEECFTTVRFGEFASDHCKFLRNKYRKDSEEFQYYSAVLQELESQGFGNRFYFVLYGARLPLPPIPGLLLLFINLVPTSLITSLNLLPSLY